MKVDHLAAPAPVEEQAPRAIETTQIHRWMTPCPQTISSRATLFEAMVVMRRFGIRHLPVLDEGQLVGIVSERDLAFAERFVESREAPVAAVMSREPYVAVPYTPLVEVADVMTRNKYGAAIIVEGGDVIGVFTTIDALRAIAEQRPLLESSRACPRSEGE